MKKDLTCITCPMGCNLEVAYDKKRIISVEGNQCKRGETYAENEIFHPMRTVTTTVRISGSSVPLLSVKTEKPVPKKLCSKVVKLASSISVDAPMKAGDIVIKNLLDTGVNLVATRSLNRSS
ncbi:MAG: DUF1667 domain-containing protein [Candidatus Omnitrophota bacterium]